jgi:hypothetical protein
MTIDSWIKDIRFIVSVTHESIKEIISSEKSSALYPALYKHLTVLAT